MSKNPPKISPLKSNIRQAIFLKDVVKGLSFGKNVLVSSKDFEFEICLKNER